MDHDDASDDTGFSRRRMLTGTAGLLGAFAIGGATCRAAPGCDTSSSGPADENPETDDNSSGAADHEDNPDLSDWDEVRAQFDADPRLVHMAGMLLATHPRPVRRAIERHRRGLDDNPADYLYDHWARSRGQLDDDGEQWAKEAAGRYLGVAPANVALTDSTTEGLATVYHGLDVRADQEVVTGHWNHWATEGSLQHAAAQTGFDVRNVALYDDLQAPQTDEIVERMADGIRPQTRVVAVTWVHSTTGMKLPVGAIGRRIQQINADRSPGDRILYCVDGVHGFGVEDVEFTDLNCDFFIAGCHKWLFGPRGTGIVVGRPEAWNHATPTVPTFSLGITPGRRFTPGGFKPYEHIWALNEAFEFHLEIGKDRVQNRIYDHAGRLLEALDQMDHVAVRTPLDPAFNAGVVTFRVDGHGPYAVVDHLRARDVVASVTPEDRPSARLAPGLLNDREGVDHALDVIRGLG